MFPENEFILDQSVSTFERIVQILPFSIYLATVKSDRPVREGVFTDSLKFHAGAPCPTLIHPAGGPLPNGLTAV
jgi:hypothetical protein